MADVNQFKKQRATMLALLHFKGALLLLRLLAATFGFFFLTYLVLRVDPPDLQQSIFTLSSGDSFVIVLGGVSLLVKTWAWRLTSAFSY